MEGEDYLSTPIVRPSGDFDILKWWQQNKGHYPRLAQVAKDILSVPITGVGVERVFNVTKDIINDRRHRLNAETIRKLTIMRDRYQQHAGPLPAVTSSYPDLFQLWDDFPFNETDSIMIAGDTDGEDSDGSGTEETPVRPRPEKRRRIGS